MFVFIENYGVGGKCFRKLFIYVQSIRIDTGLRYTFPSCSFSLSNWNGIKMIQYSWNIDHASWISSLDYILRNTYTFCMSHLNNNNQLSYRYFLTRKKNDRISSSISSNITVVLRGSLNQLKINQKKVLLGNKPNRNLKAMSKQRKISRT